LLLSFIAEHVPGDHQRHILGSESRDIDAEERVRNIGLHQEGKAAVVVFLAALSDERFQLVTVIFT